MRDLNAAPTPRSRKPRAAVRLNGTLVEGWTSWSVDNNSNRAADTFEVEFAASSLPTDRSVDWFASQSSITVEIFATEDWTGSGAYAPAQADRLIYAQTDDIDFDPVEGTVHLSGRDLTSVFIDTRTSENHQNATSSAVATLLAQRHGLTPVVTATSTRIGQYYQLDHTDINTQQTEWDLLVKLADWEDFDVFVKGRELHFQPKPTDSGDRYVITWTPPTDERAYPNASTTTLHFSRSLTIAKGVTVEVRSWNAKQKKAFTSSWPKSAKGTKPGQSSNQSPLLYHFSIPGLTQDQAIARAKSLYQQIVQHMVKLGADMPADSILDCTKAVQVRGTGTAFDQTYYPDSVRRSMSVQEGYRMTLSAKNVSQDVEAAAS